MVKKQLRASKTKQRTTLSQETHMEVFRRLAKIKIMHNPPTPRVKKGGK